MFARHRKKQPPDSVFASYLESRTDEEAAADRLELELLKKAREAEPVFRKRLQTNFERYASGPHNAYSFKRYCDGIARAVRDTAAVKHLGGARQKIIGSYFEAGMQISRRAGRPEDPNSPGPLFAWIRESINRERIAAGKAPSKCIPAQEIVERCVRLNFGTYSPDQVRKAIKRAGL